MPLYRALAALLLSASSVAAAPITVEFSGTVTAIVFDNLPDEHCHGCLVKLGTKLTGTYSFEVNPANPEQDLNGNLDFEAGGFSEHGLSVSITVHLFGDPSYIGTDKYEAVSSALHPIIGGGAPQLMPDSFGIQLEATAGGALTGHGVGQVPDLTKFIHREFIFSFGGFGRGAIEWDATLDELRIAAPSAAPEPGTLALLAPALLFRLRARRP